MDYTVIYLSNYKDKAKKLEQINNIRIYKRMYLLIELVRVNGFQTINSFWNDNKVSSIE